ncbi:hypothetical protein JCM21900_001829 [Sporobolomyces salmonicolor]
MSSSSSFSPAKLALAATGVLAAATVGYAVYFDYRRRNDAGFRRKLLKQHKKLEKTAKYQQEAGKEQIQNALRRAIALANAEKVPETAEGKEQFFMEQVALGEQLAARSPEFYVASAISFYKALKVYPAPQELIMIYQKTQPPAVFDLVMELISLEINAAASAASARSSSASGTEPLLEEIDEKDRKEKELDGGEEVEIKKAPSSENSFVHVEQETDAVVTPEGDVVAEATSIEVDVEAPAAETVEEKIEEVVEEAKAEAEAEVEAEAVDPPEEPLAA